MKIFRIRGVGVGGNGMRVLKQFKGVPKSLQEGTNQS